MEKSYILLVVGLLFGRGEMLESQHGPNAYPVFVTIPEGSGTPPFPVTGSSTTEQALEKQLQALQTQLRAAEAQVDADRIRIRQLNTELSTERANRVNSESELTRRLTELESRQASQTSQTDQPVGFMATLDQRLTNLQHQQIIVFNSVQTNLGNGYNPGTGKFRCPVKGLYFFSVTLMSSPNEEISTELLLNGEKITVNWAGGNQYGGSGSNAVLLRLDVGDLVWIRLFFQYGQNVEPHKSKFCGHLVRKMV